jgi:hypothetical protein
MRVVIGMVGVPVGVDDVFTGVLPRSSRASLSLGQAGATKLSTMNLPSGPLSTVTVELGAHTREPRSRVLLRQYLTAEQVQMLETGLLDVGFLRLPIGEKSALDVVTVHCEPFVARRTLVPRRVAAQAPRVKTPAPPVEPPTTVLSATLGRLGLTRRGPSRDMQAQRRPAQIVQTKSV